MNLEIKHVYGQLKGPDVMKQKLSSAIISKKKLNQNGQPLRILQPVAAANIPCFSYFLQFQTQERFVSS